MTSLGYWVRFSRVPERSLNCLPHVRQRNRREPWAVRSGRSVTACEPHSKHRILVPPLWEAALYPTEPSPARDSGASPDGTGSASSQLGLYLLAQALTEPDRCPTFVGWAYPRRAAAWRWVIGVILQAFGR